jgi:hypothetical protein
VCFGESRTHDTQKERTYELFIFKYRLKTAKAAVYWQNIKKGEIRSFIVERRD